MTAAPGAGKLLGGQTQRLVETLPQDKTFKDKQDRLFTEQPLCCCAFLLFFANVLLCSKKMFFCLFDFFYPIMAPRLIFKTILGQQHRNQGLPALTNPIHASLPNVQTALELIYYTLTT